MEIIRPENLVLSGEQMRVLMPYLWVIGGTLLCALASAVRWFQPKWLVFGLSLATCVVGIIQSLGILNWSPVSVFNEAMISDPYSVFFNIIFLSAAFLTILASFRYLDHEELQHPEYYVLILFSAIGMMFLASAQDLIVLFIALELMSLTVYLLVGFRRADRKSNEAAMKYFILGGAASAIMLYGVALIYGVTATTQIQQVLAVIQEGAELPVLFNIGAWLIVVGFLFKVASVPFHMWMPDVYEGAPAPITGFMTTGLKAAAFAAFVRVFISMGYGRGLAETLSTQMHHILWICAVLTMVVGNVIALSQNNLKRMLAYSSIAHTGYLIVGIIAGAKSDQGFGPVVLYLTVYAIMNMGAFATLAILASRGDEGLNLQDMSGMSRRHPWLAFAMAVFLLSMAGIPPTAGFIGKYMLFYSAVQAGEILLVVLSVLCSAISVYYYLRVLVFMYMRDPVGSAPDSRVSVWSATAVATMVFLTLQLGVLPSKIVETARRVVENL